MNTIMIWY